MDAGRPLTLATEALPACSGILPGLIAQDDLGGQARDLDVRRSRPGRWATGQGKYYCPARKRSLRRAQ